MWKSKYKCFIIRHRFVCTKDPDLAEVYALIKQAVRHTEANEQFDTLLKAVIQRLEDFAQHRRLLDESLYVKMRQNLTLGYDIYSLSNEDFKSVRQDLVDDITIIQELEDVADKTVPLDFADEGSEGYDSRARHREIRIKAMHTTRDRSIGNSYAVNYYADINLTDNQAKTDIELSPLDGGRINLLSTTPDAVIVAWGDEKFHVNFNSNVSTKEYLIDNPLVGADYLTLNFLYQAVPNYAELWNSITQLGYDERDGKVEKYDLTERKEDILHFIDKAIEQGNTGLYVAKALLTEYNNWGTCEIDDLDTFQKQLLEGIELGCLSPDNRWGWEWLEVATPYNNPTDFMADTELFNEVLATAASHGVVEAIDIIDMMDTIKKPQ